MHLLTVYFMAETEVSRIIEKLLRAANEFQVRVFFDRLSGQYANMACDRYASHVLQAVLDTLPAIIQVCIRSVASESSLPVTDKDRSILNRAS